MKKTLFLFVFLIVSLFLYAEGILTNKSRQTVSNDEPQVGAQVETQNQNGTIRNQIGPEINVENAVVFKIDQYKADDYLIFKNFTSQSDLMCNVFYYDERRHEWKRSYENAELDGYGDTDRIEVIDDEGIEDIIYLAVQIVPAGNYQFRLYEKRDDLYIEIRD